VGASSERIALDLTASGNMAAETAKARSEISALGAAATKAGGDNVEAWQAAATAVNVQIGAYERLGKVLDKTNLSAVAGFRAMGTELKQTLFAMEATESEIGRIDAAMVRLERAAGAASIVVGDTPQGIARSFGNLQSKAQASGIAVLFAFESFARGAQSAEGPARAALRSVSLLALALGPEVGIPVAGALALGDALYEMWTRSEKAARDAQIQFERTLETVGRQGFAATAAQTQLLFSGDPFARRLPGEAGRDFQIRSQGVQGLEREMARLKSITQDNTDAWDRAQIKIRELQPVLDAQTARWRESLQLQQRLLPVVQQRAQFELQQLRERAALRESQRLRPEEVPLTIGNLAEQERAFGITGRGGLGVRGVSSIDLLAQAADRAQRVDATGLGRIRPAAIIESQFHLLQVETVKQTEDFRKFTALRLGNTLADGLAAGITAGFRGGGIKAAFRAGSGIILAGLGGMLIDEGKVYLEKAAIMQALVPHLFNPATAGWAAAGIGGALLALGATLEALGSGGGRGGGAGGYAAGGGTFTPSGVAAGGGTTVIIQTVDPFSRAVVNATTYYINRGGMLNTPIIPPPRAPS
jgi:hypothetical protein